MKFTEWIRHRIVGRFREPDHRELQEIAQKAKRLAGAGFIWAGNGLTLAIRN